MVKLRTPTRRRKDFFAPSPPRDDDSHTLLENVHLMNLSHVDPAGMDIIIISTNSPELERFWSKRLDATRQFLIKPNALLFVVLEDWPGGAGNGLGTLYAWQKACRQSEASHRIDLRKRLQEGASAAIYHTAGQGQRLCPISTSEQNNKSAVKLPGFLGPKAHNILITILEAVMKQTSIYASTRKGRVSVFWGDQIFIPSQIPQVLKEAPFDILARIESPPRNHTEWESRGWQNYGLCCIAADGSSQLMEKITFDDFHQLVDEGKLHADGGIGISLGCFSVSAQAMQALEDEFQTELMQKESKLDSDPHFWMSMTLDRESYIGVMEKKKTPRLEAEKHHDRMQRFNQQLKSQQPYPALLNVIDIGQNSFWWDYGTLANYYHSNLKLTENNLEGDCMRDFFQISFQERVTGVSRDSRSCILNCKINSGTIQNSVLIGVTADKVNASDCIIIQSAIRSLDAKASLIYHVIEMNHLESPEGSVRVDIHLPGATRQESIYTYLSNDGKADWNIRLPQNTSSYAEMAQRNTQFGELEWETAWTQHLQAARDDLTK